MSYSQASLKQIFLKTTIPLLTYGVLYLCSNLFQSSSFRLESNLTSEINQQNSPLDMLQNFLLEGYNGYFSFIFMMIVINLVLMAISFALRFIQRRIINSSNKGKQEQSLLESQNDLMLSLDFGAKTLSKQASKEKLKGFTKSLILYSICYTFYHIIGSSLSSIHPMVSHAPTLQLNSTSLKDEDAMIDSMRILEVKEEEISSSLTSTLPENLERGISLAIGKLLGSLNTGANSIVLSKDYKTAYVIVSPSWGLKILDLTNLQSPSVISSLFLRAHDPISSFTAILSHNEKTLFICNGKFIEIVNVSNPRLPKLIHESDHRLENKFGSTYKMSMAIANDDKTLFIGGRGLVILNVTHLEAPTTILSRDHEINENEYGNYITSLALASDDNTLFLTNGSLCAYDVRDLSNIEMIYEYKTKGEAEWILLSEDEEIAYIAGTTEDDRIIIEKIDISDAESASEISVYEHKTTVDLKESDPVILGLAPYETNIYVSMSVEDDFQRYSDLLDLNLMTEKFQDNGDIVTNTSSIMFLSDGRHVIAASESEVKILELFLDHPNTEIFSLSNHSMSSFKIDTPAETMIFSSDKKVMFLTSGRGIFVLESWMEIRNVSSGELISSTRSNDPIISIKLSRDNQKAYLMCHSKIHIYDISDLSSPKEISTVSNLDNRLLGLIDFVITGDDKIGYFLLKQDEDKAAVLRIVNLIENKLIGGLMFNESLYRHQLALSNDSKRLFLIQENVEIFDLSNPGSPKEIISFPLVGNEAEPVIISSTFSPDEKLLFVKTGQQNGVYRLKICNVTEGNVINEISLPKALKNFQSTDLPSVFSQRFDRVYSIQDRSILITDILDLKNPKILGLIPLPSKQEGEGSLQSLAISPEENKIYILIGKKVQIVNLQVPETLYLNQEKFLLGKRYSDNVMILRLGKESKRYELVDKEKYKFLQASLLDLKFVQNGDTRSKFLPLSYWMSFDKENGIFSVEPKYQGDINEYTLCVTFGTKIPLDAFVKLKKNNSESESEKLLVSLITLGYMDNQRFLSATFDESKGDFLVMPEYFEIKSEIHEVLKGYQKKTCTKFEVIPSLELLLKAGKFQIGNLIGDNPRVDIKLDSACRFLYKTYGNLNPAISLEKDRLTLEGSGKEVNAALQEIVVDLGKANKTCGGEITLNDFANPPVTQNVRNITAYFLKNEHPMMSDITIQGQFDAVPISTGQFFTLTVHEKTFLDKSSDKLFYEVFMNDTKNSPVPGWLTIRGLTFQGVPPEEIFGRDVALIVIVKNEFKETRIPFTINIKMSSMFIAKLVMRFSPYILTLITFYIYANRIHNILLKKRYRNPKNFYAEVGKEISDKDIFPIAFIKEEKRESKLIMRYLARSVVKELDLVDTHKYQVPFYFADPMSHRLNKARIAQVIEDVVLHDFKFEDKKKLRLYSSGDQTCKALIIQLVVNEIVMLQLNLQQEETTRSVFRKIKDHWTEIIERDQGKYVINKEKLNQVLIQKLGNSEVLSAAMNPENDDLFENESPILYEENYSEGSSASSGKVRRALDKGFLEYENKDSLLNMGLLEDALMGHAFECQSLNVCAIDTVMFVGQKVERNILYNFIKKDIREIRFGEKYGIGFRVQNETMNFIGTPEERFNGKIMVIQIKTKRERILKEIWIYGVGKENEEMMRENLLKDRRYEVLCENLKEKIA